MAGWRPLKRRDFVRKLRGLAFTGPFSGTRHQFMAFGPHRQTIPTNPEYSVPQVKMLIRQVERIIPPNSTISLVGLTWKQGRGQALFTDFSWGESLQDSLTPLPEHTAEYGIRAPIENT